MTDDLNESVRNVLENFTDHLAKERGGDYTYDQTDAGYYGALDDLRRLVGLPEVDRSKRT